MIDEERAYQENVGKPPETKFPDDPAWNVVEEETKEEEEIAVIEGQVDIFGDVLERGIVTSGEQGRDADKNDPERSTAK